MTPFVRIVYFEFEPNCGGGAPNQVRPAARPQRGGRTRTLSESRSANGGRRDEHGFATIVRLRQDCQ